MGALVTRQGAPEAQAGRAEAPARRGVAVLKAGGELGAAQRSSQIQTLVPRNVESISQGQEKQ